MIKLILSSFFVIFSFGELFGQNVEGKAKYGLQSTKKIQIANSQNDNPQTTKTYTKSSASNANQYPMRISKSANGEQITYDKTYYENRLNFLNRGIQAIDFKVDFVRHHPEQDSIAKANNWYQQMEHSKNSFLEEKASVEQKLKSFK